MLLCISPGSWDAFLGSVSPAVVALVSAIALWVASRARSTSLDALSISSDHEQLLPTLLGRPGRNVSRRAVRDRRKSSTKVTTSTSRGERPPGRKGAGSP
jgi:hypothetical protein